MRRGRSRPVSDREMQILRLWGERSEQDRDGNGVLSFYLWLENHFPDLLAKRTYGFPTRSCRPSCVDAFFDGPGLDC